MEEKKQRLKDEKERNRQQELKDLSKDPNPYGRAGGGAPNRDMILNAKILLTPGFERQDVKNFQEQVMNAPQGFYVGPD
jgi:hypothetical protein